MTQNGLKHILNMFLKSVTKTDLDPPLSVTNVTLLFLREGFNPKLMMEILILDGWTRGQ